MWPSIPKTDALPNCAILRIKDNKENRTLTNKICNLIHYHYVMLSQGF